MSAGKSSGRVSGLIFSPWNLLLIIPLWILITPIFNQSGPTLFGLPFFYWFQFLGIVVGVVCTSLVFVMTNAKPTVTAPADQLDVDDLDEGTAR